VNDLDHVNGQGSIGSMGVCSNNKTSFDGGGGGMTTRV